MRQTPLPPSRYSDSRRSSESSTLLGVAFSELRDQAHLIELIGAADRGEVPPDAVGPSGEPILATALRRWWRVKGYEEWVSPLPRDLARFEPGQVWDGQGACRNFEHLAAALIAAGVELFPKGPRQMDNLVAAVEEGASATAVSLLLSPQCPSLKESKLGPSLLAQALSQKDTAVVQTLLSKGVGPNALVGDKGAPAWFFARNALHLEWLLAAGADVSALTTAGQSAAQWWSEGNDIDARGLSEMGRLLAQADPSAAARSRVEGAFSAVDRLQVGAVKSWVAQDASVLDARLPLPGVPDDTETLVQKALRLSMLGHRPQREARARGTYGIKSPPMGLLRAFLEHPNTSDDDRAAVALVALSFGSSLGRTEKSAQKTWMAMKAGVASTLADDAAIERGWAVLGDVCCRLARVPAQPFSINWTEVDLAKQASTVLFEFWEGLPARSPQKDCVAFARALVAPAPFLVQAPHPLLADVFLKDVRAAGGVPGFPSPPAQIPLSNEHYAFGLLVALVMSPAKVDQEIQAWAPRASVLMNSSLGPQALAVLESAHRSGRGLNPGLAPHLASFRAHQLESSLPSAVALRPAVRL